MNATPADMIRQHNNAIRVNLAKPRPVYSTSTGDIRVNLQKAPLLVSDQPTEFVGPCGCSGCEKWADCYYCDGCRAVD